VAVVWSTIADRSADARVGAGERPVGELAARADALAGLTGGPATATLVGGAALVAGCALILPFSLSAPGLRVALETAVLLFGGVSAWLLWPRGGRSHVVDLLPVAALIAWVILDVAVIAVPATLSEDSSRPPAPLASLAICLLCMAVLGFALRALRDEGGPSVGMLLASVILIAAGWVCALLSPATDRIVSNADCLRAGALVLVLIAGLAMRANERRTSSAQALARERRRLAVDLHDSLAQDLAFIAAYADRWGADRESTDALGVAARRALAISRGIIADLSASRAPNVEQALRDVAAELAARHGLRITVAADDGADLRAEDREAVVRIAREAIVNAAQHGHAENVAVALRARDRELMLRIADDGCGIGSAAAPNPGCGIGLSAMRELAQSIGAQLLVEPRIEGGTAVEVAVT
jgi:signal transduction histidine kinase